MADSQKVSDAILPANHSMQDPNKQRRESRVACSIEIEVSGIDNDGRPFLQSCRTCDVSDWGCSFRLPFELQKDAIVALRLLGNQPHCFPVARPVMFQVASAKQGEGTWLIGTSKLQPDKLWDVDGMRKAQDSRAGPPPETPQKKHLRK